jgi:FkbM family methyltransferase
MLLSLSQLVKKYSLKINGVIHVGAHYGQEVPEYMQLGIKNIVLIEPCTKAFNILKQKFGSHHHIKLFNYACASATGEAIMYTESANQGQSNSLLRPADHLKHYPTIQFTGQEVVKTTRLDLLGLGNRYNMLNIDVQGAEANVIVGAEHIMPYIDYVYTEVNTDTANLYQGATGITTLDALLNDFTRVETAWVPECWGDALYIRKTKL